LGRGRERVRVLLGEGNGENRRDPARGEQAGERDDRASAAELAHSRDRPSVAPRRLERRVVFEDPPLELF
jgi:hypothetical protein